MSEGLADDLKDAYEEEAHDVTADTEKVVEPITDKELRKESDEMQEGTDDKK